MFARGAVGVSVQMGALKSLLFVEGTEIKGPIYRNRVLRSRLLLSVSCHQY